MNDLMDKIAKAITGESPLTVREKDKPRTEPAKGDWAP
jgi:hypothetical protein